MKAKIILVGMCLIAAFAGSCDSHQAKKVEATPAVACEGTCSGGKNCTACKNCKYCKHCAKQGGSCSVCKGK